MLDEEKLKLFDSAEEEEEEENDDFKIRPQYEGPHGLEMLEMNSQLSKRFKLDERFAEDFEPGGIKKSIVEELSEVNEEKKKNIRILETILGHEVNAKSTIKNFIQKQQIRFDPEDENASKFIKAPEKTSVKPKSTKKKKEVSEEKVDIIPTSTERYIEVCSNLKEILNTSTPFSFSQKFSCDVEATTNSKNESTLQLVDESCNKDFEIKKKDKLNSQTQKSSIYSVLPKSKCDPFFVIDKDPRLKEGIEFFKRSKPLEEIRIEWQKRRTNVLELFRQKRRTSHQARSTRTQSVQLKNRIRKHHYRK